MDRRLGKGLSSLLGNVVEEAAAREIDIASVSPNPFQPRKSMDPGGLEELRDSIANHGVMQPIMVRRHGSGYQLVAGERRWRAARLAGLERIPAVVREDLSDQDMLELALVENVQRRDLDPIERGRGFKALMDTLGVTQEVVAGKVGLKRATVANHLRLLDLPDRVQDAVAKGLIQMGHARALLGLTKPQDIDTALEACVRSDLSVRDVEQLVRDKNAAPAGEAQVAPAAVQTASWVRGAERRLEEALGVPVTIRVDAQGKGEVRLRFATKDVAHRLLERLAPAAEVH
jgi:ParB family chromosome partitioning protein